MSNQEIVFVVESCQNCGAGCGWHTRHDEAKYTEFFKRIAAAIIDRIPNAMIMKNQIPKQYLPYDLYNNLVPNEDDGVPYYQQVPRTGAFEVSYKGMLVFSKLKGGYWPNCELVADKCVNIMQDEEQGKDCSQYLAGNSPLKAGGYGQSTAKKGRGGQGQTPVKPNAQPGRQANQPTAFAPQFGQDQDEDLRVHENNPPSSMQQNYGINRNGPDVKVGSHLKSSDDLTGFPVFPPNTKSLVCKNLSRVIWEKYSSQQDQYGFPFVDAIFSGCKNVDSGIGIYAGSQQSYQQFSDIFNPIIDQYHGHNAANDFHPQENPNDRLNAPDFPPDEAAMIRSTRIRVGRNLDGYPLGPGIYDNQTRADIEGKIVQALNSFTGELKGTYYPLNGMSPQVQAQMIEDHFLFKEGDRFLEACRVNEDWPNNRGIFHNAAKTFLTWVNEEDQLRIISMQQGSNIRQVFERLTDSLQCFEKVAKFSYDPHLGYITSCPTNLGTAMRASVHICLPLLGQRKDEFERIANKYHVQIRGAHGEHTETNDGIFDISNKRRLGMSMTSLVQDMYDGVKAMIKREKELMGPSAPATQSAGSATVQAGPHLKQPSDLTGMIQFPAGTKSLLAKYLSPEVFEAYRGKSDGAGVSFEQMILSGSQNIDSGIGVYAGSHQAYYDFCDLFDPIIEDYHQHGKKAKHISNMDYTQLKCPPFTADEASMILSTRIRVGRNLADYPLGPGITKQQRDDIEKTVAGVLTTLTGELKGTYYALNTMTKQDQEQLIADHFLFKEGDRFLDAAGLNRDWPSGRGIFHNDEKTFLTWVNEEDQLRIISMQKGPDILAVFTRLSMAASAIEKVAKFAHDDHLGYITSCPTNCGTALRASVHIKLPNLAKKENKAQFDAIAAKYYVQIRGIHGEHTETDDGIFDISNRRRLGRSEVDLVQDMYDGVKAMIAAEKALCGPAAPPVPVKAGPHLKQPSDITGMVEFPAGTKSLLCKYLTPEVYNKYRGQTDECGVSFEQMILSGSQNVDSGIGAYAGCHQAYYQFSDLFDRIIEDYHQHKPTDKHVSNMDYNQLKCPPLKAEDAAMILSTRIRVGRNLADVPLGPGISKAQRKDVEQRVSGVLKQLTGELEGSYYDLGTMSKEDQNQLIADHFLFKEGDRFLDSAGLNREWPDGRGIFHNKEKTFLTWVNEEDQLRIISMQKGADILAVFTRLSIAAAAIEKVAKFAHDDHLGYITSCPTNCGTALRASVHIQLPNLAKKENKAMFDGIADKYYVQIRGIHGEHTETDDGIFDISNRRRLGRSEVDLVQDMYDGVKAMIEAERSLGGGSAAASAGPIQAGPHLKDISQLTSMPVFPAGTKSLVSKYCTPEVFEANKGKKDSCGVPFEQMILSGCQNVDSGIGVYAGCHQAYYEFDNLFAGIVEEYHGHGKDAKHTSNMDYTQLKCPPFTAEDAAMILSTRIRVGRNLADVPLGPGISKEQRDQVEKTVSGVLQGLTGELAGKYYPLSGMSEADQNQLIADHFLFKEGDRFLAAAGLNRDWPSGRGIFHNDAKTFLTWVNEEDQLRIISMQKGADLLAVFTRLSIAAGEIEKVAKFAHDDHLGYITSCPTNCGTALRASVHIQLPILGKKENKAQFDAIAEKYYVQIRGIHGEHTETDDGIFDISNRRRLGRSEVDLVQDMYDGVKAMIAAERALGGGAAPAGLQAGPHLTEPSQLTSMPVFPAGTKSLVSKYCTPEVFEANKGKCDKAGVPFEQMILSGCQNVDSGIGVYAGSHDAYTTFNNLFEPIINDYHGHAADATHVSNMNFEELECPDFPEDEKEMIISTRIRVGRNLADFPLGPGISKEQRDEVEKIVSGVLTGMTGELEGTYYPLNGMSKEDQNQLIADHFLFKEGDRFLAAAGLNRDWPSGRGIFHNKDKTFLTWVNEEDQLRIISMQPGSDILAVFRRLSVAAREIEKVAKFAHDDHLGYITSCPTNCGTALRASVHIKLPKLMKQKEQFNAIADKYYVQIRGIHGEHTETDDGIFDISNRRRLGRSEKDLVQDMYNGVKALIAAEKAL